MYDPSYNQASVIPGEDMAMDKSAESRTTHGAGHSHDIASAENGPSRREDDDTNMTDLEISSLHKRALTERVYPDWANSQISAPVGATDWATNTNFTGNPGADFEASRHTHYYDTSEGQGQWIYVLEECVLRNQLESVGVDIKEPIMVPDYGDGPGTKCAHGYFVASQAVGTYLGIARRASLVPVHMGNPVNKLIERQIHALTLVLDDILGRGPDGINKQGKAVINMSTKVYAGHFATDLMKTLRK